MILLLATLCAPAGFCREGPRMCSRPAILARTCRRHPRSLTATVVRGRIRFASTGFGIAVQLSTPPLTASPSMPAGGFAAQIQPPLRSKRCKVPGCEERARPQSEPGGWYFLLILSQSGRFPYDFVQRKNWFEVTAIHGTCQIPLQTRRYA